MRAATERALTDGQQKEATLEEVQVALEGMVNDDDVLLKLRHVATRFSVGNPYSPEDLVQEAFVAALELRRRWNPEHSFFSFICSAMRSIAWDDRTSLPRRTECSASGLAGDDDSPTEEILDRADTRTDVQTRMAEEVEQAMHDGHRQRVDALFALFAGDEHVLLILMAMEDGLRGADIEQHSGLSSTEHATARRRMKRRLATAYPRRGS